MIGKYKQGICSECGQDNLIVYTSGKLCYICNLKRKADKRKPLNPISKKGRETMKKDTQFYEQIWNERPHRCEECGTSLGNVWQRIYFSHILTKGSQPTLRHNKENINLLCAKHHIQWETGHKQAMRIYSKNRAIIQKLKQYGHNPTI